MKKTSIFSLTAALMMTANLYAQSSYKVTVNPNILLSDHSRLRIKRLLDSRFCGQIFQ